MLIPDRFRTFRWISIIQRCSHFILFPILRIRVNSIVVNLSELPFFSVNLNWLLLNHHRQWVVLWSVCRVWFLGRDSGSSANSKDLSKNLLFHFHLLLLLKFLLLLLEVLDLFHLLLDLHFHQKLFLFRRLSWRLLRQWLLWQFCWSWKHWNLKWSLLVQIFAPAINLRRSLYFKSIQIHLMRHLSWFLK